MEKRLLPYKMDSMTRIQIPDESISFQANILGKGIIIGKIGLFDLDMATSQGEG